jgi:DNA-binding transcriptional LysR family regulator
MFDGIRIEERDMSRNLDLSALRSLVTVADSGGVTRAAGLLNLTQSAVSMQLKRLEESLGLGLIDRSGRGVSLTPTGELLASYARRMLQLNDEALGRLTRSWEEGEIVLGVPHDIIDPVIPQVMRRFASDYPRIKINLLSLNTKPLRAAFDRGELDVILTTEERPEPGAETVAVRPLVWVGARGGQAWKTQPLRLAFNGSCIYRPSALRRLDDKGIPWEMAVESSSDRSIYATVSADLAVHVMIEGSEPPGSERINHGGELPELWSVHINLYSRTVPRLAAQAELVELIRREFAALPGAARPRLSEAAAGGVAA